MPASRPTGRPSTRSLSSLRAAGCSSRNIYREKVTGARANRRELLRMLDRLTPGDVVTMTRIDRLARSTFDLFASRGRYRRHCKARARMAAEEETAAAVATGAVDLLATRRSKACRRSAGIVARHAVPLGTRFRSGNPRQLAAGRGTAGRWCNAWLYTVDADVVALVARYGPDACAGMGPATCCSMRLQRLQFRRHRGRRAASGRAALLSGVG